MCEENWKWKWKIARKEILIEKGLRENQCRNVKYNNGGGL